jgi:hypothetical protein
MGICEITTFKNFLYEARVNEPPTYRKLSVDEALHHLKTDFSDAAWMVEKDKSFYRGDWRFPANLHIGSVDTAATERKSENTANYYTLIFDNHPEMKQFPKRSRSFICATESDRAAGYGGQSYIHVVPGNSAKIGDVGQEDMWDTIIDLFGESGKIHRFNSNFEMLGLSDSDWNKWIEFDRQLKDESVDAMEKFFRYFPKAKQGDHLHFLEEVQRVYSPKSTGQKAYTAANLPHNLRFSEVWIGGPCLVFTTHGWQQIRAAFKGQK